MAGHITICAMPHATGWHAGSWRRPSTKGNDLWNPELWKELARTCERGKLDAIFFADNQTLFPVSPERMRPFTGRVGVWDAVMMAALVASATSRIGIVATAHTEFHQPYALARQFACLDHITGGRIGWNVVTSAIAAEAKNFSADETPSGDVRYRRATEFVEVVKGLWDSWEDDAYLIDQETGVFFDAAKLHPLNHHGEFYDVAGPLNVMRPPQGYPVIAQAGGSGPGKQLAGRVGELIFTFLSGEAGKEYRDDVRRIAVEAGRDPDQVKVLSVLLPLTAATDAEADAKWVELQRYLPPDLARTHIELMMQVDLSTLPPEEPLPQRLLDEAVTQGGLKAVMSFRMPDGRVPTVRELIENYKGAGNVVGSPSTIADYMEAEVDSGACDGFVVMAHGMPEEIEDFVEHVVPELQRRGRFHKDYAKGTFREQLGFERPRNRYAIPKTRSPRC